MVVKNDSTYIFLTKNVKRFTSKKIIISIFDSMKYYFTPLLSFENSTYNLISLHYALNIKFEYVKKIAVITLKLMQYSY